jgi:hypothetical protein
VPIARINPPDNNCATDKLTMKAALFPVGFNEEIDRSRFIRFKLWLAGSQIQPSNKPVLTSFIAACLSLELTGRDEPPQRTSSR